MENVTIAEKEVAMSDIYAHFILNLLFSAAAK